MKIESIEHLKKVCDEAKELLGDQLDFYIMLNYGVRSSKTFIFQDDGGIVVVNEIDGTSIYFKSVDTLMRSRRTNIGKAVKKGAFFVFDYDVNKLNEARARKEGHKISEEAKNGNISS